MTLLEQIQEQVRRLPQEKQREVLDFVKFLQQRPDASPFVSTDAERAKRIKKAFLHLAKTKAFGDIPDPVAWQRQIRKDRPLPGRES